MKKSIFFSVVAIAALSLTSCKKDHECVCTVGGVSTTIKLENVNKKDAKAACDTWKNSVYVNGTCELK